MTEKVFISDRNTILKLLSKMDSITLGNYLEENNLIEGKKSELSDIQNMVLSCLPDNETIQLKDIVKDVKQKYPTLDYSHSGYYRILHRLQNLGLIVKPKQGGYKKIKPINVEDILNQ